MLQAEGGGLGFMFDNAFTRRFTRDAEVPENSPGKKHFGGSLAVGSQRSGLTPVTATAAPRPNSNPASPRSNAARPDSPKAGGSQRLMRTGVADRTPSKQASSEEDAHVPQSSASSAREFVALHAPVAQERVSDGSEAFSTMAKSLARLAESVKAWQEDVNTLTLQSDKMMEMQQQTMRQQGHKHIEEILRRELNLQMGEIKRMMVDFGLSSGRTVAGAETKLRVVDEGTQTEAHHAHLHGVIPRAPTSGTGLGSPKASSQMLPNSSVGTRGTAESSKRVGSTEKREGRIQEYRPPANGMFSMLPKEGKEDAAGRQPSKSTSGEASILHATWNSKRTASADSKISQNESKDQHGQRPKRQGTESGSNGDRMDVTVNSEEWAAMLKEVEEKQLRERMPQTGLIFRVCIDAGIPRRWLPEERVQVGCMEQLVRSPAFVTICTFAIVLNAFFVGLEADSSIKNAFSGTTPDQFFVNVNRFFVGFFATELVLKLMGLGRWFIFGQDGLWNLVDVLIVAGSIYWETQDSGGAGGSSAARIARVLRLMRVGRVLRTSSFFHELRLMASSILSACSPLAWGAMVLVLVMYIFAVFLLQGAAVYVKDHDHLLGDLSVADNPVEAIREWYSSLGDTMFTLFYAITGGKEWATLVDPFLPINKGYRFAFVAYTVVAGLGVLKLFTAVFVVSVLQMEEQDETAVIHRQIAMEDAFIHGLRSLIHESDPRKQARTEVTGWWLQGFLRDQRVQAFFTAYQLDWRDVARLFEGEEAAKQAVSIETFVLDCARLRGAARNFDLVRIQKDVQRIDKDMHDMIELLQDAGGGSEVPPSPVCLSADNSVTGADGFDAVAEHKKQVPPSSAVPAAGLPSNSNRGPGGAAEPFVSSSQETVV